LLQTNSRRWNVTWCITVCTNQISTLSMKQESLNPSSCFSLQALKKIMWHGKLLRIGTMSKTLVQEKKKKRCGNRIDTLSHWNWKTQKISWPKKEERIEAWVLKTWKTAPLYTIPVPPFESFSKTKNCQDSTDLFRVLKRSSFKLQGNMATPMLCLEKKNSWQHPGPCLLNNTSQLNSYREVHKMIIMSDAGELLRRTR
jgi:hypothetical protein